MSIEHLVQMANDIGHFFASEPQRADAIERRLATQPGLKNWRIGRSSRVDSGFYISQALEVVCS